MAKEQYCLASPIEGADHYYLRDLIVQFATDGLAIVPAGDSWRLIWKIFELDDKVSSEELLKKAQDIRMAKSFAALLQRFYLLPEKDSASGTPVILQVSSDKFYDFFGDVNKAIGNIIKPVGISYPHVFFGVAPAEISARELDQHPLFKNAAFHLSRDTKNIRVSEVWICRYLNRVAEAKPLAQIPLRIKS